MGTEFFYSHRCVSCRSISLPSLKVLRCKLAKITLFIYSIKNWVECMPFSVRASPRSLLEGVNYSFLPHHQVVTIPFFCFIGFSVAQE